MTEKRFEYNHVEGFQPFIYDVNDNHMVDDLEIICELLNDLNDENEQLKQREKTLEGMIRTFDEGCKEIYDDKCRLEEENEQLKHDATVLIQSNKDYRKENEQLKQEKDKWKQQCIHFKEMLDDMDIAYLCDEWIYEELEGDVE